MTDASEAARALAARRRTKQLTCPECSRVAVVRVEAKTCGRSTCRSRIHRRLKSRKSEAKAEYSAKPETR